MELVLDSGIVARFSNVTITRTHDGCYGLSDDGLYAAKVQFGRFENKQNDLEREVEILRYLMDQGCRTSPEVLGYGDVKRADSEATLSQNGIAVAKTTSTETFRYLIMPAYKRPAALYTPDVLMAVIEQKKLGVWQGDLRGEHVMADRTTECIKFIDYDQAIFLTEEQRNMPNLAYFEFIDDEQQERFKAYGKAGWMRDFHNIEWETHFKPFFVDGSLDIGATYLFKNSETTLRESKIYHTFQNADFHAKGERSFDDRVDLLDQIDFEPGERVLDIGCNAGLLCHYLLDRGCDVTGIDIDPAIIDGAKIIANIMGKTGITFECLDIDNGGPLGYFDTVMLFSVIHHTRDIHKNAARIAKFCKRIVIETRLKESGAKPVDGKWIGTTVWKHETLDDLIKGLEFLFPGHKHTRTLGQGDRDRYVMILEKQDAAD